MWIWGCEWKSKWCLLPVVFVHLLNLCALCICILKDTAREILRAAPGVTIVDDRAANRFPTPLEVTGHCFHWWYNLYLRVSRREVYILLLILLLIALVSSTEVQSSVEKFMKIITKEKLPCIFQVSNKDDVAVGRIRQDLSQDDNRGYGSYLRIAAMNFWSALWICDTLLTYHIESFYWT